MSADEIHKGNELAIGESIVWQGGPAWRDIGFDVFHLRAVAAYFAVLFGVDGYQAWAKNESMTQALHDSVPLAVLCTLAFAILIVMALCTARAARYTITNRRVILHYGIAMPATLSLPYERIAKVSIAIGRRRTGNIPLGLRAGNHVGYLKLWPLARPWRLSHPEPMLRAVPRAAVVVGLLTRAIAASQTLQPSSAPVASDRDITGTSRKVAIEA